MYPLGGPAVLDAISHEISLVHARGARHEPLAPTFRAAVETLTRRPVRAYMTDVGPEDVAFEGFILA